MNESSDINTYWEDDRRMEALYAPFREVTVNHHDSQTKITFWKAMIHDWLSKNNRCTFSYDEITLAFLRKGKIPACLQGVLEDMLKLNNIVTYDSFFKTTPKADSWSQWGYQIISGQTSRVMNKLRSVFRTPEIEKHYVHLKLVKEAADRFLVNNTDSHDKLISISTLFSDSTFSNMPEADRDVLLHWLYCQGKLVKLTSDPSVVKIKGGKDNNKLKISELDVKLFSCQNLLQAVTKQLADYETKRDAALKEATEQVRKNKDCARSALRKKKTFDQSIQKVLQKRDNLELVLHNLQDMMLNKAVFACYSEMNDLIKKNLEEAGITEETVTDVMDDIADTAKTLEHLNQELAQPANDIDDAELEDELQALLVSQAPGTDSAADTLDDFAKLHITEPRMLPNQF